MEPILGSPKSIDYDESIDPAKISFLPESHESTGIPMKARPHLFRRLVLLRRPCLTPTVARQPFASLDFPSLRVTRMRGQSPRLRLPVTLYFVYKKFLFTKTKKAGRRPTSSCCHENGIYQRRHRLWQRFYRCQTPRNHLVGRPRGLIDGSGYILGALRICRKHLATAR